MRFPQGTVDNIDNLKKINLFVGFQPLWTCYHFSQVFFSVWEHVTCSNSPNSPFWFQNTNVFHKFMSKNGNQTGKGVMQSCQSQKKTFQWKEGRLSLKFDATCIRLQFSGSAFQSVLVSVASRCISARRTRETAKYLRLCAPVYTCTHLKFLRAKKSCSVLILMEA